MAYITLAFILIAVPSAKLLSSLLPACVIYSSSSAPWPQGLALPLWRLSNPKPGMGLSLRQAWLQRGFYVKRPLHRLIVWGFSLHLGPK
ncbi:hypothetical protein [Bradyrhizobium sp. JR3.5]